MADISSLGFDANQVKPNEGFDVLPAGEYDVVIVGSKVEPTKSGNGKLVNLELQVLTGPYQNRKLFDRLNLWNPSEKAVQIARGTLSAICRAVNVLTPKDTSELHNKPLRVKVTVTNDETYGQKNEIRAYKSRSVAPPTQEPALQGEPVPAGNSSATPW